MLEAVYNTDGSRKQVCEYNAPKRFIEWLKQTHTRPSLYCVAEGYSTASRW